MNCWRWKEELETGAVGGLFPRLPNKPTTQLNLYHLRIYIHHHSTYRYRCSIIGGKKDGAERGG